MCCISIFFLFWSNEPRLQILNIWECGTYETVYGAIFTNVLIAKRYYWQFEDIKGKKSSTRAQVITAYPYIPLYSSGTRGSTFGPIFFFSLPYYTWSAESGEGVLPRRSRPMNNVCSFSVVWETADEAHPKKVGVVLNATGLRFGQLN